MTTLKQIDAKIRTITTNAAKLNVMIHETGVAILEHANQHGDCTRAQMLVMAMPASMRRTMLIAWFTKFSPIVTKPAADWTSKMHKVGTKLFVPFDIEGAKALPFYQMAEENPEGKSLDFAALMKMVEGLAKRIDKAIEEGKVEEGDVLSARAISNAVAGLKVERVKSADAKDVQDAPVANEPDLGLKAVA